MKKHNEKRTMGEGERMVRSRLLAFVKRYRGCSADLLDIIEECRHYPATYRKIGPWLTKSLLEFEKQNVYDSWHLHKICVEAAKALAGRDYQPGESPYSAVND